jgi:hypothetical protein
MDDFFTDLENSKPFLKVAAEGFAGSGKTYTLALLAVGLHQRIGSTKPIAVFDTEKAAKFLRPLFQRHGIKVLHKESRSMADLAETMRRCREGAADVLFIDSISHVWENFVEAYKAKANRNRLEFSDWAIVKPTWKAQFSDPFVRDPYHTMMTGRAAYEYENEVVNGKREIYKSGVKMKVEGETAYEPDVLLLMERFEEVLQEEKKVWRETTVLKDRSTLIDGRTFKNATYEDFAPAIDAILLDAVASRPMNERSAGDLFSTEEDKRRAVERKQIALAQVEALLVEAFPGQTADEKRHKVAALRHAYGDSMTWRELETWWSDGIVAGLAKLEDYAAANGRPLTRKAKPTDDDVPGWGTPPPVSADEAKALAQSEREAT